MRHVCLLVAAGFVAASLSGCGSPPSSPDANDEPVALAKEASPTVATGMGPFEEVSGCSGELTGNWYSAALDVNSDGIAVGYTGCVASETLTFRWSELRGMEHLSHFPGGYPIFPAESINESGTITGVFLAHYVTVPPEAYRPILWTVSNSRIDLVPATLCDPPEEHCAAPQSAPVINDNEMVVGTYFDGAYRWTAASGLVYLPLLAGWIPAAINSRGDIVAAKGPGAALLRKFGRLREISGIRPTSMNDKRLVVGASLDGPHAIAAIWSQGKGVQLLGTLGGTSSVAYDVNNKGEVVGASTNAAGEMRAFYWARFRGMVDLGPGIAYAISDAGHMVGVAPSGLIPPDTGTELWQAVLWRGTAGVQPTLAAVRRSGAQVAPANDCLDDERNWRSKSGVFHCISTLRGR